MENESVLEKLIIKGFQKHENRTIEFDRITCIVGPNDVGKSSILRALFWLTFNRPSGNQFKTWDLDSTIVKLVVDGKTVIKKKGRKSYYSLDGKKFKAFGTSVPPQISDHLKMERVNFQKQKDPLFWLSLSPAQVSKELNRIVDLDIIDSSLSDTAREIRKTSTKLEVLEEELKDAQKLRKSLKWTVQAQEELDAIIQKQSTYDDNVVRINVLSSLISDVERLDRMAKDRARLATMGRNVTAAVEKHVKLNTSIKRLSSLIEKHEQKESELCRLKKDLERISKSLASVRKCPVCQTPLK
jgi:DNA repair exonuclease SbcCD ATPase subunit